MSLPRKQGPAAAGHTRPRRPSIKLSPDGIFIVAGARRDHQIPYALIVSSRQGRKAVNNPARWKTIHGLIEVPLRDFTVLQIHMMACAAYVQRGYLWLADDHKREAQEYLADRNKDFRAALRKIKRLPYSRSNIMIFLRVQLEPCWDAIISSFAWSSGSEEFQASVRLVKHVTGLLWEALHLADQILENHFKQDDL